MLLTLMKEVASLKITDSVFQLDATKRSHAFLVKADEIFLIDTGMPDLSRRILSEIRRLGTDPCDIRAILLTHHDVDHIGNAQQLQNATGAELWASSEDLPYIYIAGEKSRPRVKRLIEAIVRPGKPVVTETYGPSWPFHDVQFRHAPGHTPGHTIFQFGSAVFTGDLFKYNHGRFRSFSKLMNWDEEKAQKSLSILKGMKFEWACPSHGSPIRNGRELQKFLAMYD